MFARFSIVAGTAGVLSVSFVALAAAQDYSAKTAWTELRTRARDGGIMIASGSTQDLGGSLIASNVRIFPESGPQEIVAILPELRVESRGGAVALVLPPSFDVVSTVDDVIRTFTVTGGGEVAYDASAETLALNWSFPMMRAILASSTRARQPTNETFSLGLTNFSGELHAEREGRLDLIIDSPQTEYSFGFDPGTGWQSGEATMADFHVELAAEEMDMISNEAGALRAAFDAGFFARLRIAAGQTTGISNQMLGGAAIVMNTAVAQSVLEAEMVDGAFSMTSSASDYRIQGGMGPMQGGATIANAEMAVTAPLVVTPENQPARLMFAFRDVVPTEQTLAMINAQAFAGESISIVFDATAQMRLLEELGDGFGSSARPPFEIYSVTLDTLETRVGDASLTGLGGVDFFYGVMASMGNPPRGAGRFVFDLIGGQTFVGRLAEAGLIPQDQVFFAQMMMNGLGQAVAEDHLRSEVELYPDGRLTVNGAPLPF